MVATSQWLDTSQETVAQVLGIPAARCVFSCLASSYIVLSCLAVSCLVLLSIVLACLFTFEPAEEVFCSMCLLTHSLKAILVAVV